MGNHVENKEAEIDFFDLVYTGESAWRDFWRWFTTQWASPNDRWGGKCKYEITDKYYRITLELIPLGTCEVPFGKGFYVSRNGYNVPRKVG